MTQVTAVTSTPRAATTNPGIGTSPRSAKCRAQKKGMPGSGGGVVELGVGPPGYSYVDGGTEIFFLGWYVLIPRWIIVNGSADGSTYTWWGCEGNHPKMAL